MRMSSVSIALIAALLLSACAAGAGNAPRCASAPEQAAVWVQTPEPAAQPAPSVQRISAMLPVLDSLVRALGIEGESAYAPDNAEFFWTTLYLTGVNWGHTHPLARQEDGAAVVPAQTMQEFAGAAFFDCSPPLPAIPESLAQSVFYDEALGAYRLAPSDMGETTVRIDRYTLEPGGGAVVYAGLYAGDGQLGQLRFVLADNPVTGARYPYGVTAAENPRVHEAAWRQLPEGGGQMDLDGDGAPETVELAVRQYDAAELTVRCGGTTYTDTFDYFYNPQLFFADTRTGDGGVELYLCGDMASEDYVTYVYRIVDGQVQKTSLWGHVEYADGQGRVRMETWIDVLGSWSAACWYALSDGFTFERASDYAVYQYPGMRGDRGLIIGRAGLPAVTAEEGEPAELAASTRLLPVATDCLSYVVCELDSGETVRIEVTPMEDVWEWRIGGVPETDWFGEVLYSG